MSIRLTPTTPSSRPQDYASFEETVAVNDDPLEVGAGCCFCVPNCDWDFPVFAFLSSPFDREKNDRNDFIFNVAAGSTLTAKLIQLNPDNTVKQTITIVDNTYGQLFPTGTIKAGVWAFWINWHDVADVEEFGRWKFNVTIENGSATETYNQDTVCFHLMPWTCENAHRTIKIQTEQSGYFEGGFDYTGISFVEEIAGGIGQANKTTWPQELRLWGIFFRDGFPQERDNLVTQNRGKQLVQSKIWKKYKLKLDTIPTILSNRLVLDMLQAPEVYITDQNISNIEEYVRVRVDLQDIDDPINFRQNKNEFFEIEFVDWQQDNVHRFK